MRGLIRWMKGLAAKMSVDYVVEAAVTKNEASAFSAAGDCAGAR